jgi:hypothetical protein
MKILLKKFALLLALPVCALASFPSPAAADSTASLILSKKCGDYNINIWRNYRSGELLYRSTSRHGDLSLGRGTTRLTEGVRLYQFQNDNYEYWVWDGILGNPQPGSLEVYRDNSILMQQDCAKN